MGTADEKKPEKKQDAITTAITLLLLKRGKLSFWHPGVIYFCQYEGIWGKYNQRQTITKSGNSFPEAFRDLLSAMTELKDK